MKVWVVYCNEPWEYSHPFAVFSTKQLAKEWIKEHESEISIGIQELEVDHSPKTWIEIEEDEE